MYLESLTTYKFRNLVDATISLTNGINLFIGHNGQGKTNILEAVAILGSAKSFRTSRQGDFIRWGDSEASVFSKLALSDQQISLGVAFQKQQRELYLNHEKVASLRDFVGKLATVTFSPLDIFLVKGSPSERRRFIDKHLVDTRPAYLDSLISFHRAVRNKNALLRDGATTAALYEPWNSIIAEASFGILIARLAFIEELQRRVTELYQKLSPEACSLSIALKSNLLGKEPQPSTRSIMELLGDSLEREIRTRTAIIGPHRDDLVIMLHGADARSFASQGESRSIVLALKLAVIELIEHYRKESPVVLLDDVDAELDHRRRNALFEMLLSGTRQVIVTGTQESDLAEHGECSTRSFEVRTGAAFQIERSDPRKVASI